MRAGELLGDLGVGVADHVALERVEDVLGDDAADQAVAQLLEDLAALGDGGDVDAVVGAAVLLGDDDVLRHVDEAAGQVARSRRSSAPCRPGPCGRRGWR